MTPLDEDAARRALTSAIGGYASRFDAGRVDAGWAFQWSKDDGPVPLGYRTWVVTDSGTVGRVKLGETADQAAARLHAR